MEVGLVGKDWQPTNWAKRQFESDTSTARVQKYRASKSEEKEEISDTDTDTERNVTCNVSETFHETLPHDTWAEWIERRKARRWSCSKAALSRQLKLLEKFDTATQREIIDNSIQAGWQGLFPPKSNGKGRPTRYEELMQRVNPPSGPNPLLIEGKL